MITLELQIKSARLTPEQEEEFRLHIRRNALTFLFAQADSFGQLKGIDFAHGDLGVTGEIKTVDQPAQT